MMSWNATSQNVTDSTTIQLTKPIAKLVIQDIVLGDQLQLQLVSTQDLLRQSNLRYTTQSNLVLNLESQIKNYNNIVKDLNSKSSIQNSLTKDLEKALKKQRRRTAIYKITSAVGAAATLLLLVQ